MAVPAVQEGAAEAPPPAAARVSQTTTAGSYPSYASHIPLSMRRAPALDLNTVERRGHQQGSREPVRRVRPHGITDAPTFRPSEEEFRDPMEYIKKIAPEGSKYGICKIIPPESWQPPFAIDTKKFHFRTRRQELNSVEGSTRMNLSYLDQLAMFHKQQGMNLNRFPSVDKRPLDLYKLKKAVETRGGFEQVCRLKKWAEIGRDLGYSGKIMSSLSTSLKNSYQKWLMPYEEYLRVAKPGVQQQRDYEQQGGALSPSPANSPMNRSHSQKNTPGSNHADSPAMLASAALHAAVKDETDRPSAGFTSVNSGGFTAVNYASASLPNGHTNGIKKEGEGNGSAPQHVASHSNTPDHQNSPSRRAASPVLNGTSNLKRTVSHESGNGESSSGTNADSETPFGRRSSKRQKKDTIPTVAGSHMSLLRPLVPRPLGPRPGVQRPKNTKPGERCESCGLPEDPAVLAICDSCDNGYHRDCMDPPIKSQSEWNCPKCLVGTGEFGFEEGGIYGLAEFQEKANNFKDSYFGPKMPFDPILNRKRPVTEDDVEREFWRLVESITETVEVEYGADIHSTTHGSGFPDHEAAPLDPYSTSPWNLNVLPLHAESLFRHIKSDISGMTVPWLYVGMCFSTFCWHNEDHYTYSANYQHFGATKTWYGIPGKDALRFEEAMRNAVPELFEQQPDLLFQLVTLLPPNQLKQAGVNVYALDQRAGQFVVTFPQAYHAGFNHGFNFNEAVNFAPSDWEPFGQSGVDRLQEFRRQPCFSHDELLMTAAARDTTIKTAKWLAPALGRLQDRELAQRFDFLKRHRESKEHRCRIVGDGDDCTIGFEKDDADLPEEEYQCAYCKAFTYLSRYQCHTSGRVLCLLHAGVYECCGATAEQRHTSAEHTLRYRLTDEELKALVAKVIDRARSPEVWQEKLDKVLDNEPKPALKALRSLVSEGERIPFEVVGLADLKAFVECCNEWVEEATNYIVRKQQNRRKNERVWRKATAKGHDDDREKESRRIENMYKLLEDAEKLAFDDPTIATLRERAEDVSQFQRDANVVLHNPGLQSQQDIEDLIEMGKGFNVDVPEVEQLEAIVKQLKWNDRAAELQQTALTLADVDELLEEGKALAMPENHPQMAYWVDMRTRGVMWESKAKELISAETIPYHQLEALANQASTLPVSATTRSQIDAILSKQREAHRQIIALCEKSKDPTFENRPKYKAVRELLDSLQDLNSKPTGTVDLEKEVKRHEDWMRRGKKLFGKANAPLHILLSHMMQVRDRNEHCLSLEDKPRMPVEPASRDQTPEDDQRFDPHSVFCICRQPEGGMMIECELCHEWYHGKCLKIARGKIKVEDKYTCPICDHRVKIPRDAARPKLEDLQDWQAEITGLPFQPEEEDVLEDIISAGQEFRDAIRVHCTPIVSTPDEVTTQRFYLRKIEGADILLAYETNFFRQELHKWAPVAPEAPAILEISLSTRKPRPTKQQKLMAQLGIDNPDDLPVQLRTKAHVFKTRKASNSDFSKAVPLQPAPLVKTGSVKSSGQRTSSVGNTPQTPNFSQMFQPPQTANPNELANPSPSFPWHHRAADGQGEPALPPSPIFRPTTPNSAERAARAHLDPSLFSPSNGSFVAAALRETSGPSITLASPLPEGFGSVLPVGTPGAASAASGSNMDKLFADFTTEGEKEHNEAGEALEARSPDGSELAKPEELLA